MEYSWAMLQWLLEKYKMTWGMLNVISNHFPSQRLCSTRIFQRIRVIIQSWKTIRNKQVIEHLNGRSTLPNPQTIQDRGLSRLQYCSQTETLQVQVLKSHCIRTYHVASSCYDRSKPKSRQGRQWNTEERWTKCSSPLHNDRSCREADIHIKWYQMCI